MTKPDLDERRRLDDAWAKHEREQARRMAAMPFAEKLRWLEQAHRLVLQLQRQDPPGPPESSLDDG